MVFVISCQISDFLSSLVLQQNDADLTDWVLVKELFDEHLKHLQSVYKPRRLQIWN